MLKSRRKVQRGGEVFMVKKFAKHLSKFFAIPLLVVLLAVTSISRIAPAAAVNLGSFYGGGMVGYYNGMGVFGALGIGSAAQLYVAPSGSGVIYSSGVLNAGTIIMNYLSRSAGQYTSFYLAPNTDAGDTSSIYLSDAGSTLYVAASGLGNNMDTDKDFLTIEGVANWDNPTDAGPDWTSLGYTPGPTMIILNAPMDDNTGLPTGTPNLANWQGERIDLVEAATGSNCATFAMDPILTPVGTAVLKCEDNGTNTIWYIDLLSQTVSYDGNGNTGGTAPAAQTVTTGTFTTAAQGDLVKDGYTFTGWNTAADGSGTSYAANSSATIGDSDITLYAVWALDSTPTPPNPPTIVITPPNNGFRWN